MKKLINTCGFIVVLLLTVQTLSGTKIQNSELILIGFLLLVYSMRTLVSSMKKVENEKTGWLLWKFFIYVTPLALNSTLLFVAIFPASGTLPFKMYVLIVFFSVTSISLEIIRNKKNFFLQSDNVQSYWEKKLDWVFQNLGIAPKD